MNNNTKNSEGDIPEKVLELVPWYAIGNLSVDDRAFFEKAMVTYSSLQKHLDQEQQIIENISTDHSLLEKSAIASTDERLKSVFNMIDIADSHDQSQSSNNAVAPANSFFDKLKSTVDALLSNANGVPQYARIASLSALVVSVAVLSAFVAPLFTDKSDYIPASANTQPTKNSATATQSLNTVLLVGINGSSVDLGNNSVLQNKLLKIETVPEKKNMYRISFKQKMSAAEIKQTIDALLAQKELIWFAGEAF